MSLVPMAEVARQLEVSRQTLAYYIRKRKLTAVKVGGIVAQKELTDLGFYERRLNNHRPRSRSSEYRAAEP
jgi:hypothetical protein